MTVSILVFRRRDGLYDWHLRAKNGQIVATSGSQGYTREADARRGAHTALELLTEVPDDADLAAD